MQQKDFILRTWPYLLVVSIFCIIGVAANKYYGEIELHQLLNQYHNNFLNAFFAFYTKTGEWYLGAIILLYIIYKKTWRYLSIFLTATILQFTLIQAVKRIFFRDHLRPAHFFEEEGLPLHLIEGIEQGITYSFPSGHTATAFFLFSFLALLIKNNVLKFFLGLAAILSAYSRVYLSQHFVQDTVGGGMIGLFCLIVTYYLWLSVSSPKLDKNIF